MKKIKTNGTGGKAVTTSTKGLTRKQAQIIEAKQLHPEATTRELGKLTDSDHAYVLRTLRKYGLETRRDVELFKANRSAIFAGVQGDLVCNYYKLSDEDKRKLILKRGLVDAAIMFDKERLEEGLSTENVLAVIADLEAIREGRNPIIKDTGIE